MGTRRKPGTGLPAPYLRRISWARPDDPRPKDYPFSLPYLDDPGWNVEFTTPVTIIMGENGSGKSTLIEAIAGLAGYDETGGGKGYRPVDHSTAIAVSGTQLAEHLRAAWLPKITAGWFFRAETFWAVARYLDDLPGGGPDFLSHSHGEGFLRVFGERCRAQGLYLMDEPESALSPAGQMDLVELLADIQETGSAQVILATHSPILMAVPGARLLQVTRLGLADIALEETRHFKLYRAFCQDPHGVIAEELRERRVEREAD
ncbi:putative ATPase [Rhodovulum bhavnagarense]|uniref:Putative ATPase n=1 Tax=Rhodovulum bhavnagarense TaxID=992286 RepID=A0A4R2R7G2_9RHOB|nr:AAA family ATPase [Rhodovulum bhavnagarense]TCP58543.1 putative ATPase [Rhodovulum bhavnagarense]